MIYDPTDTNLCMNEVGVLFFLHALEDGKTEWVELGELRRDGQFRRPEW